MSHRRDNKRHDNTAEVPPNDILERTADLIRRIRHYIGADECLRKASGGDGGFVAVLQLRLVEYETRLSEAIEQGKWTAASRAAAGAWGPVSLHRNTGFEASDMRVGEIRGPAPGDLFPVAVLDADEIPQLERCLLKCNHLLTSIRSSVLAKSDAQLATAFGTSNPREDSYREDVQDVHRNRIRLLQQYNDIKDVGQQLIGLVAENRGVRIGSLYQDDEFGVGPHD